MLNQRIFYDIKMKKYFVYFTIHKMAVRSKSEAGKNEELDIQYIIESIAANNLTGVQLKESYKSDIGEGAISACNPRNGGNRKKHYDFFSDIEVNSTLVTKKTEHKGCQKYKEIQPEDKPWLGGVQFHNGGCELYPFTQKYARVWYDTLVASGYQKEKHNITAIIPTFDEFWKECKTQGDPKTEYMSQLKYRGKLMREERKRVLNAFELTREDIITIKDRVLDIANSSLSEKELWLTINGDIHGKFYSKWYPQFRIKSIDNVEVKKELDLKIYFTCKIEMFKKGLWVEQDEPLVFHGHLRWGSHQGITNLRFDLK